MTTLAACIQRWPEVSKLISIVGCPYSFGAGNLTDVKRIQPSRLNTFPTNSKGGKGIDCSAVAQWALWVLGLLAPDAWVKVYGFNDISAHELANQSDLIKPEDYDKIVPGDMYFYQRPGKNIHHVTVALGYGLCLHASGTSSTNGDNPYYNVQIVHYTRPKHFKFAARIKPKHRPEDA